MSNSNHSFTVTYNDAMAKINKSTAQAVFRSLCSFKNKKNSLCFPSIDTLAKTSNLSRSSIIRSIKFLKDIGLVKVIKRKKSSNNYILSENGYISNNTTGVTQTPPGVNLTLPQCQIDTLTKKINKINKLTSSSCPPPCKNKIVDTRINKNSEEEEKDFFCFYSEILEEYNKILGCKLRTAEPNPTTPRILAVKECTSILNSLSKWDEFFNQILNTSFLCGGGKKRFKADFDWIIDQQHFIKIKEGKYETNEEKAIILELELMDMLEEKRSKDYDIDAEVMTKDYKATWASLDSVSHVL